VRYRQTLLGVSWAVLQPLLMMTIFAIVFSRLAGIPS
jgi:lipopolysaccharide transport system permease protein